MVKLKLTKKSTNELYNLREIGNGVVILKEDNELLTHLEFYVSKEGSFVTTDGRNLIDVLSDYETDFRINS